MKGSVIERLYQAWGEHPPGPAVVLDARRQAWQSVRAHGLPTRKVEDWKYTSLGVLDRERYLPPQVPAVAVTPVAALGPLETCDLVFDHGRLCLPAATSAALPDGVRVCSLADASRSSVEDLLSRAFAGSYARPDETLAALNTACAGDGVLIDVAAGARVKLPLRIVYRCDNGQQRSVLSTRNLLRLGEGARLTLVEEFTAAQGQGCFSNVVTRVVLNAGAEFEHLRCSSPGVDDVLVNRLEMQQQHDSNFVQFALDHGCGLARHDLHVDLEQAGSACALNGLYLQGGSSHTDNHIRVRHRVGPTRSRVGYRGVLGGRTHGVFNAKALVEAHADGSDARQSNRNILLSKRAAIDTKPELEIYAEDVHCSHGATVGQLDDHAMFYLRSRGIDQDTSRAMLLDAFCHELLHCVSNPALLEVLRQRVATALASIQQPDQE